MKTTTMLVLTGLALILTSTAWAMDLQTGFSKYRWGDSAKTFTGLAKMDEKGEVSYYSKTDEIYTLGDAKVDEVVYGFKEDRFFGVYLNIYSLVTYDKLLQHMQSLYGLPRYTTTEESFIYKWKMDEVTIKLKMNKAKERMKLAYYYQPIAKELNAGQWEDLETSSFRFVPIEKDKKPERYVLFEF